RIIAGLTRIVRDVGLAEDLAQDALVAALEQWPESGIPDNPGAWLMATAKHRAIDRLRRGSLAERKHQEIGRELDARQEMAVAELEAAIDDPIGDDLLRLVFISCHPVLPAEARVALTLRLLGGLTTDEIARASLVADPTIAQRLVRAWTNRESQSCSWIKTGGNGINCSFAAVWPRWSVRSGLMGRAGHTRCRPRSPRVTLVRVLRQKPTGRISRRSMGHSPSSHLR